MRRAPSVRSACSALLMPEAGLLSGQPAARAARGRSLGIATSRRRYHADPRRRRLLPPPRRCRSGGWCRSTAPAGDARSCCPTDATAPARRVLVVVAVARAGEEHRARLPLEAYLGIVAATNFKQRVAQDDGVLPRRPAALRRRRHAEPPGVRPGLLRQERRRRGRPQADRAPVQDARSTSSPSTSACPRRSARRARPPTPTRSRSRRRSSTSRCRYEKMDLCLLGFTAGDPPEAVAPAAGLTPAHGHAGIRAHRTAKAGGLDAAPTTLDRALRRRLTARAAMKARASATGARVTCRRACSGGGGGSRTRWRGVSVTS